MFADIHNHLVPGVDDGAKTLDDSFAMLDQAVAAGVKLICATPHLHGDPDEVETHQHHKRSYEALKSEIAKRGYDVEVYLGCEVYCTPDINELAALKEFTLREQQKYMLIELPPTDAPHYFPELCFQLKMEGITPILAHPERNLALLRRPEILVKYIRSGILTQVTTDALTGGFGEQIMKFAERIVKSGACTVLSSDAHNTGRRSFASWPDAFKKVNEIAGTGLAKKMSFDNAKTILEGNILSLPDFSDESADILKTEKKKRFFFF
ncbi:MAG: CpsB/CapC family capsule biosynthesis tyrosine phosphatase [Bacteroidota bacterium]